MPRATFMAPKLPAAPTEEATCLNWLQETAEWTYTSLHDFGGQYDSDGAFPFCTLVIDAHGNLYGTTDQGGIYNDGVIFEITH